MTEDRPMWIDVLARTLCASACGLGALYVIGALVTFFITEDPSAFIVMAFLAIWTLLIIIPAAALMSLGISLLERRRGPLPFPVFPAIGAIAGLLSALPLLDGEWIGSLVGLAVGTVAGWGAYKARDWL